VGHRVRQLAGIVQRPRAEQHFLGHALGQLHVRLELPQHHAPQRLDLLVRLHAHGQRLDQPLQVRLALVRLLQARRVLALHEHLRRVVRQPQHLQHLGHRPHRVQVLRVRVLDVRRPLRHQQHKVLHLGRALERRQRPRPHDKQRRHALGENHQLPQRNDR